MTKAKRQRPTRGRKTTKTSTPNPMHANHVEWFRLRMNLTTHRQYYRDILSQLQDLDDETYGDLRSALHDVEVAFENAAHYAGSIEE